MNEGIELAAGEYHTCARIGTAVRCWGQGQSGQLGYGNTNNIGDNETPASAGDVDVGGQVRQIGAGNAHTCALLTTGDVRCWGHGFQGQLGYGNTGSIGDNEAPASAGNVNIGGPVDQIALGGNHTCALLSSGQVRCWGANLSGQLGYAHTNTIGDNESPASAGDVNLGGTAKQISAGEDHTCALLTSGHVRCWGFPEDGRLGYGNTNYIGDNEYPSAAGDVPIGGVVQQIEASVRFTCALLSAGTVRCWGNNGANLGYGNANRIGDDETPASVGDINVGDTVQQIAAGGIHTCALLTTGNVRCWGINTSGALGYANPNPVGDNEAPASAGNVDVGGRVRQIVAGYEHTCALLATGAVRCWGSGSRGELGYGNMNAIGDDETPNSAGHVPLL